LVGLTADDVVAQQELWYAIRDDAGWSAPVRLTDNSVCDDSPALSRREDGSVIAVWRK